MKLTQAGWLIGTHVPTKGFPFATTFVNVIETTTPEHHWVKPLYLVDDEEPEQESK